MFLGGRAPAHQGRLAAQRLGDYVFLWGRDPFLRREKGVPSPQAPIFLQTGFGTHKKRRHAASFFVRGVPGDPACRGRHDGHGSRQAGLQSNRAAGGTAMDQVRRPISPAMIRRRGPPMPIRKKFWKGGAGENLFPADHWRARAAAPMTHRPRKEFGHLSPLGQLREKGIPLALQSIRRSAPKRSPSPHLPFIPRRWRA